MSDIKAKVELLPCPFCGTAEHLRVKSAKYKARGRDLRISLRCLKCGITTRRFNFYPGPDGRDNGRTPAEFMAYAWNTRDAGTQSRPASDVPMTQAEAYSRCGKCGECAYCQAIKEHIRDIREFARQSRPVPDDLPVLENMLTEMERGRFSTAEERDCLHKLITAVTDKKPVTKELCNVCGHDPKGAEPICTECGYAGHTAESNTCSLTGGGRELGADTK